LWILPKILIPKPTLEAVAFNTAITAPWQAENLGVIQMSVQVFILIQTEVGKATSVAKAVSAIPGVTLAEGVTGPYDVIMRAESPSMEDLGRAILAKVQAVPGITRTLTCPVTTS
jgi:DNA-binding Lrp family transcriptional regulator